MLTTLSTSASAVLRGVPGLGSSSSPSTCRSKNRDLHFPTVGLDTLSSSATAVFVFPSAHPSIIRARWANACAVFGRRAHASQCLPFFIGECQRRSRSARAAHVHPPQMSRQKDTRYCNSYATNFRDRTLGADVELVVMLGPNGSGKSSVFDAFLQWARAHGRPIRRSVSDDYFDSETRTFGRPEVILHDSPSSGRSEPLGPLVHVRTAHRNTPDVLANSIQKQEEFRLRNPLHRMVETDAALSEHYQRLVARFFPILSNLESGDAVRDLETVRAMLAPVQDSLTRVLPHLGFAGMGDPTSEGSFYFTRDETRKIPLRESLRRREGRLRPPAGCPHSSDRARHPTNLPGRAGDPPQPSSTGRRAD